MPPATLQVKKEAWLQFIVKSLTSLILDFCPVTWPIACSSVTNYCLCCLVLIFTFHLFEAESLAVSADVQYTPGKLACEPPGNFPISAIHIAIGVLGLQMWAMTSVILWVLGWNTGHQTHLGKCLLSQLTSHLLCFSFLLKKSFIAYIKL